MPRELKHRKDFYNGIEVKDPWCSNPNTDITEFGQSLHLSLVKWHAAGRRGVWMKITTEAAHLIPVAIELGFQPHHANKKSFMLTHWLSKDQNKLPPCASHFLGVGGFVLNSKEELLMIQEKSGPAAKVKIWKLPGGLCDPRERLCDAVVREVKEETGIVCEFISVCTIQETHGGGPSRDGSSDLYSVCFLKPRDENQPIVMQESEIVDAKWIPIQQVMKMRFYQRGVFKKTFETALLVARGELSGLDATMVPFGFRRGFCSLLHAGKSKTAQSKL